MGIININGIKVYAYHGCMEEEAIIGGNYIVDVKIKQISKPCGYIWSMTLIKQLIMQKVNEIKKGKCHCAQNQSKQ